MKEKNQNVKPQTKMINFLNKYMKKQKTKKILTVHQSTTLRSFANTANAVNAVAPGIRLARIAFLVSSDVQIGSIPKRLIFNHRCLLQQNN